MRNLLTLFELSTKDIQHVFAITEDLKTKFLKGVREPLLPGRTMALLFEKQSLRTRVSFETAMQHLGGGSLFLGQDVGWGERESIADFARVLGQYVDVLVARVSAHEKLDQLAEHAQCAVVNGLSDLAHPCQALADLYTMREVHGSLDGQKLAFVGDSNNVARSLAVACAKLGVPFAIASPKGYLFDQAFTQELARECPGANLLQTHDPVEAVRGATAVYTDVWTSMGQEGERAARTKAFAPFQVNQKLLRHAADQACFLHCLPARRGEEVTDEVIDGTQSVVVQQAGNRLHVQKGLLAWLLTSPH